MGAVRRFLGHSDSWGRQPADARWAV